MSVWIVWFDTWKGTRVRLLGHVVQPAPLPYVFAGQVQAPGAVLPAKPQFGLNHGIYSDVVSGVLKVCSSYGQKLSEQQFFW